jgi:hypothetical protein
VTKPAQGQFTWQDLEPNEKKRRKEPRRREILDIAAFRKLIARGFDGRPKDTREETDQ